MAGTQFCPRCVAALEAVFHGEAHDPVDQVPALLAS
jgi:hypothetical protein